MHYSVDTYMIVEEADVQCFRRLTVKYGNLVVFHLSPQSVLAKYDIASCKELYGEVFADGGNCNTGLNKYEHKFPKKATLQTVCCASCSGGPGVSAV